MSDEAKTNSDRGANGRSVKGHPGGPGRPPGRNAFAMLALDDMGADVGKELFQLALKQAREGNVRATFELLQRVWPRRQSRPVRLDLPSVSEGAAQSMLSQLAISKALLASLIDEKEAERLIEELRLQLTARTNPEFIDCFKEALGKDKTLELLGTVGEES